MVPEPAVLAELGAAEHKFRQPLRIEEPHLRRKRRGTALPQLQRALDHDIQTPKADRERLSGRVRERALDLLSEWVKLALHLQGNNVPLKYNALEKDAPGQPLLHEFLSPEVKNLERNHVRMKFRAGRSLRDVEANTNLFVKTLAEQPVEEEDE
jgi:hypothetical protein